MNLVFQALSFTVENFLGLVYLRYLLGYFQIHALRDKA